MARSAIVWNGLKRAEHVVGRQTVATAALKGAAAGAWFVGFFGLLVALFVDTGNLGEAIGIVVTYVVMGAIVGAAWFGFLGSRGPARSNPGPRIRDPSRHRRWSELSSIPQRRHADVLGVFGLGYCALGDHEVAGGDYGTCDLGTAIALSMAKHEQASAWASGVRFDVIQLDAIRVSYS